MRHEFAGPEALATALAGAVAAALRAWLAAHSTAVLAVSGGTTPQRFLRALAGQNLAWARVVITLVDERCVPQTSARSNAGLVQAHLCQGPAAAARFVPLDRLNALDGLALPLAAAVLGMGLDGHTASFFPGGDNLAAALNPEGQALAVPMQAPAAGEPRITLTLPVLLAAGYLALHIEGAQKRLVLDQALQPGPVAGMPVRAILARHPAPEIFWSP